MDRWRVWRLRRRFGAMTERDDEIRVARDSIGRWLLWLEYDPADPMQVPVVQAPLREGDRCFGQVIVMPFMWEATFSTEEYAVLYGRYLLRPPAQSSVAPRPPAKVP